MTASIPYLTSPRARVDGFTSRIAAVSTRPIAGVVWTAILVLAELCCNAGPAWAHVKWFAPYDIAADPAPLSSVFSREFMWVLWLTIIALCVIVVIDCLLAEYAVDQRIEQMLEQWRPLTPDILRVSVGVFLLCLWLLGGTILTPELKTESQALSWFQLALAMCTLSWRTTFVAGAGIFVLYGIALQKYGLFHLMDYPLFLGIGIFLMIYSLGSAALQAYALPILYASMAQTLLWASIEKWAFWDWTIPLLQRHSHITFGIDPKTYILIAGFVEFAATFLLLVGRLSQRLVAAALLVVFVGAVADFGKIDAVGHLLIIATLVVAVINGNTGLNRVFHSDSTTYLGESAKILGLFLAFLAVYFVQYYALHALIVSTATQSAQSMS